MCCIIYEFVRRHRKIAFKTLTIISLEHCQTWHELLSVVSNSWQKLQTFPLLPLVFELSKKWGQGNNAQLTKGGTVKSQWICTLSPNKWLSVISTPFPSRNAMKKKIGNEYCWPIDGMGFASTVTDEALDSRVEKASVTRLMRGAKSESRKAEDEQVRSVLPIPCSLRFFPFSCLPHRQMGAQEFTSCRLPI